MPGPRSPFSPSALLPVTVAGGMLLGLQVLRALFPLLVYVGRDRFGLSSVALGVLGAVVFSTAFLLPGLVFRGTAARALGASAAILAALRAALQLWSGDPAGALVLAALATISFLAFLAAVARAGATAAVVPAALLGAALDASIHALAGTRDLHWGGTGPTIAALGLVFLTGAAALRLRHRTGDGTAAPASSAASAASAASAGAIAAPALLAWGPWLLLELELFGNVARLSSRTGGATAASGVWIAAGLGLAAFVAAWAPRTRTLAGPGLPLLAAAALIPALVRSEATGALAPMTSIVAQVAGALLLARALQAPGRPGSARSASLAYGGGFLAFLVLVFGHYAGYDLPVPGSRLLWHMAAAAILVVAASRARPAAGAAPSAPVGAIAALGLAIAVSPLLRPAPADPPPATPGDTVRAITFNLHNGFDEDGRFALDNMLDQLAAENPDVVALQEVNRGWLVNGCTDLYELARGRLRMHGAFGPAISTDWGNAVFSRLPPDSIRTLPLPPRDLPLTRQATIVDLPPGPAGVALRVIATHFHHVHGEDSIRAEQAAVLAALGAPRGALLLGDFNAVPGSEAMAILGGAGWQDAGAVDPGPFSPTYPARAPARRIDTVLAGGSSRILGSRVAPAWGSDHRAVIADIEP